MYASIGNDQSVVLTHTVRLSEVFYGNVKNDLLLSTEAEFGAYQVFMDIPKTQLEGIYDYEILLSGGQVPTPQTEVFNCTNVLAADLGLIPAAGRIYDLDEVLYSIEEDSVKIDLHEVRYHCEQTPVMILSRATRTFLGRDET